MKKCLALAVFGVGSSMAALVAQQPAPAPAAAQAPTAAPAPAAAPARATLAQRIAHTDPSRYRVSPSVHGGPGQLNYFALFNGDALDTNLWFLHRGVIQPKSGIGQHFHNYCEEMFVILNGEAQFTIDGRTTTLKGPAGAPARMGHSHAIYNPTDAAGGVDEHQRHRVPRHLRRVRPERWPRRRPARSGRAVHEHAARSRAAAADSRPPRRQGDGAVPARVAAHCLPVDVGLRRPPGAAAGRLGRPRRRARHRRLLLRDERRRHGHSRWGDRRDQGRRCDPPPRRRDEGVREHRRRLRSNSWWSASPAT